MTSKITFNKLYQGENIFENEKDVFSFLKEIKNDICTSFIQKRNPVSQLDKTRPVFERVEIEVANSEYNENKDSCSYEAEFEVLGTLSGIKHDIIKISLFDVPFLKDIDSIENYLVSLFKLRYRGCLSTEDDISCYSNAINLERENSRTFKIKEIADYKDEIELRSSILELAQMVKRKPFEVTFELHGIEQKYISFYDNNRADYLKRLIERTQTHNVNIRVIDNEIAETFEASKNITRVKKVKRDISKVI